MGSPGMARVLTIGTFDLFHEGHVNLLERCRDLGTVIVGVNDSEFVESFKGRAPVVDNSGRERVVMACRYVSDTFIHYGRDFAKDDIETVAPDIIAVGDDWRDRDYLAQLGVTQRFLDERGIRLVYLPRTEGVSSTLLRDSLTR
jgi:glycerol-3-phosphate cytidylyltransferase